MIPSRERVPLYWPFPSEKSRFKTIWNFGSTLALTSVFTICRVWLTKLSKTKIYMNESFRKAVEERPADTALVTVTNHYSCIDDPLMWGCLNWKFLFKPSKLRWSLAAHDICFTNKWHSIFCGLGQVVPVVRGDGIYQRGVDFVLDKMNEGHWINIFPEGRVNMEKTFIRLKWGVGRLISECQKKVIVIPVYHVGMDDVLPNKPPYIPRVRKHVTILFGDPIHFTEELEKWKLSCWTAERIRKEITDIIQDELGKLKIEAHKLHECSWS